jgi:ribosomal-protein-alanine N-acetyltransferase
VKVPVDTARLRFEMWQEEDLALAIQLWGDPRVTALFDGRGALPVEAVRERLEREVANAHEHGVQYWRLHALVDGTFLGCCGLKPNDLAARVWELGFHLLPSAWGRGYATEAGAAVVAFAFDEVGATALFAGHHPENHASRRALGKLGFQRIGEALYPPTGFVHPNYLLRRADP